MEACERMLKKVSSMYFPHTSPLNPLSGSETGLAAGTGQVFSILGRARSETCPLANAGLSVTIRIAANRQMLIAVG
jgi:hypothetical protein